jgi:hypothetical protein
MSATGKVGRYRDIIISPFHLGAELSSERELEKRARLCLSRHLLSSFPSPAPSGSLFRLREF